MLGQTKKNEPNKSKQNIFGSSNAQKNLQGLSELAIDLGYQRRQRRKSREIA